MGSTLATIRLSKEVALVEGLADLALLLGLQFAVAWSASRSPAVGRVIKSRPTLLFYDGNVLEEALRAENVSKEAMFAGFRQHGFAQIDDVYAIVLESDGSLSVIGQPKSSGRSTIEHVRNAPEHNRP